jgi:hypothetical protein
VRPPPASPTSRTSSGRIALPAGRGVFTNLWRGKENSFLQRAHFSLTPPRRSAFTSTRWRTRVSAMSGEVSPRCVDGWDCLADCVLPRWMPKVTLDLQTDLSRFPNWPPSIFGGLPGEKNLLGTGRTDPRRLFPGADYFQKTVPRTIPLAHRY